jgi:hypothetical protein
VVFLAASYLAAIMCLGSYGAGDYGKSLTVCLVKIWMEPDVYLMGFDRALDDNRPMDVNIMQTGYWEAQPTTLILLNYIWLPRSTLVEHQTALMKSGKGCPPAIR